ncbi:hypothetical protein TB2_002810 [Malus domestica]
MEIDTLDPNNILLKLQNNIDLVDANGGVCMVAFIFADKPPNRGASVDTAFAITAPDQVTANKILQWGPWNLHGVPLGQYSCIVEAYEEVLQVKDPFKCPDGVRGFLRIRLQLDARKAIPSGCWLAREKGKPSRRRETDTVVGPSYIPFGESLSLTPFSSRPDKTFGTTQSGGEKITSIQTKTTILTECASSSNLSALEARNVPSSMVNAAVETPNTELTLQMSLSHSLQQNFLFLSHHTHYFPCENPFNTTSHPWPTYQPKNTPISILLDPLIEPTFESPASNASTVSKTKDGPFFPGRKPLKLQYSRVGGIMLNPQDLDLSNTTLGKQKRVTFTDSEGDQRVEVQINMAKEITFGKETSENIVLEDEIGDPTPIEVEEIKDNDAEDSDNLPGGGGWPRIVTGHL